MENEKFSRTVKKAVVTKLGVHNSITDRVASRIVVTEEVNGYGVFAVGEDTGTKGIRFFSNNSARSRDEAIMWAATVSPYQIEEFDPADLLEEAAMSAGLEERVKRMMENKEYDPALLREAGFKPISVEERVKRMMENKEYDPALLREAGFKPVSVEEAMADAQRETDEIAGMERGVTFGVPHKG